MGALQGAAVAGVSAGAFEAVGLYTDPQMPPPGVAGPPAPPLVGPIGAAALHGAAGGLIGGMSGQGFSQGALIGGLSAGASKYIGGKCSFGVLGSPEDYIGRIAVGGTVGAIAASYTGGNPLQSFAYSALMAGIAYEFNDNRKNYSEHYTEPEEEVPSMVKIFVKDGEARWRARANMTPEQKAEAGRQLVVGGVIFIGSVGAVCLLVEAYPVAISACMANPGPCAMVLHEFLPSTLPVLPYEPTVVGVGGAMVGNGIQYLYRKIHE